MDVDPAHHRKSLRLKGYDYSQAGFYFITIVANGRCLYGEIINDTFIPNDAGKMIADIWQGLPRRFPDIDLDIFQLMPNHFHGILAIQSVGATPIVAHETGATPVVAHETPRNVKAATREVITKRAGTRPAPTRSRSRSSD